MIQRCPNCGNWVESDHGFLNSGVIKGKSAEYFFETYGFIKDKGDSICNFLQNKIGGKAGKVAQNVSDSIALLSSVPPFVLGGVIGVVDGETNYFLCDNCKMLWVGEYISNDQSKEYNSERINNFKELPEENRRFLFVDHNVSTIFPEKSKIVVLQDFPDGITYMGNNGYPVERTLYAIHPGNNHIYIPLDSFHSILLDDELSDLRIFLQALGAKVAEIKNENENISETNNKSTFSNKIKGSKIGVGKSEVNVDIETEIQEYRKIAEKYFSEFESEQKEFPYIREDLKNKWFKVRPNWEKTAQLRLNGAISDTIKISSVEITESWKNEINQLAVEYENIESKLGNSTKTTMFKRLKTAKSFTLKIHVEYYPLSSYKKDSTINDWLSNIFKKKN